MDEEELDELDECVDCGATVDVETDPSFPFGSRGVLCLECAIRRGGIYDADEDRWTSPPDLRGLESEAAGP